MTIGLETIADKVRVLDELDAVEFCWGVDCVSMHCLGGLRRFVVLFCFLRCCFGNEVVMSEVCCVVL